MANCTPPPGQTRTRTGPATGKLRCARQGDMHLTIEKLVHGGLGLARNDGAVVFVSDVVPGETVRARLVATRARCGFAKPLEILDPSPYRRAPFCPYVGVCGGCDWQHIAYTRQVELKRDILLDCLRRQGKLSAIPDVELFASPETRYRLRAQLKVNQTSGAVGFFRRNSNEVVDVRSCPLLVEPLDEFIEALRGCDEALPQQVKAIAGERGLIASAPVVTGAVQQVEKSVDSRRFRLSGNSFFQNNVHLLAALGRWAAGRIDGGRCLDLYGGAGFFAAMLSECFSDIVLVEAEQQLVSLAVDTFTRNHIRHCQAIHSTAERFLNTRDVSDRPDCIIVDPPRQGMTRSAHEAIMRSAPPTILFVSCDPATQARDAGIFVNRCGYDIMSAALFDLYPNTHHLESILLLRKG